MIRDEVLFYATIALLAFLAFYLMPTYERMTDGIEVDPRTKAATSPTTAVTPQTAYPAKSTFGPSHISPFLGPQASEQPTRPQFPAFEQFTTQGDIERTGQSLGGTKGSQSMNFKPNNVVPAKPSHNNTPSKPSPSTPSHSTPSAPSHSPPSHSQPSHSTPPKSNGGGGGGGGGGGNGGGGNGGGGNGGSNVGGSQSYSSRGQMYNLPTATGDNTPPLSNQAPQPYSSSSSGFQQTTLPAPSATGGSTQPDDPLNQYVLKSSLVPYFCPGSCGTTGQLPSSKTPGDMDMPDYTRMKPNQKNIGRPQGEAFSQRGDEPQPFLTDFAPFTK